MDIQNGICPFCGEEITVTENNILRSNTIRRNVYRCPKCENPILKCMGFGCRNFAAGGKIYDDNFCPECTKAIASAVPGILMTLLPFGGKFISKK